MKKLIEIAKQSHLYSVTLLYNSSRVSGLRLGQMIIIFIMLFAKSMYAQPFVNYYIKDGKAVAVEQSNPLPVQINGQINLGDVSMIVDTSAQHYSNVILAQQLPMNFTITTTADITTTATALPSVSCRQVDITVDFDYTGVVYVGSVGLTINNGIPLRAGDACTFYVSNLNQIFILGTETKPNGLRIKYSGRQ